MWQESPGLTLEMIWIKTRPGAPLVQTSPKPAGAFAPYLPSRRYPLEIQKPSTDIIRVSTFKRGEIEKCSTPIPSLIFLTSLRRNMSNLGYPKNTSFFLRGSSPPLVLKTSKNCKTHEPCTTDSICGIYGSIWFHVCMWKSYSNLFYWYKPHSCIRDLPRFAPFLIGFYSFSRNIFTIFTCYLYL